MGIAVVNRETAEMSPFRFLHVDVFTDTPLEGNPLAVLPHADGLDTPAMQRIAKEFNLSETVFVFPSSRADCAFNARIFTPASELPFAGHPTIGVTYVARREGIVATDLASFSIEERVGPVPVRIDASDPFRAWLTTPPIRFGPTFPAVDVVRALGLEPDDLCADRPVQIVSAGPPFLYVPIRSEAAVDRAIVDARAMRAVCGDAASTGVYVFAVREGGVYSRMFAPENGIVEDPATGSATGPLAAYAIENGFFPDSGAVAFVAEQGTKMGRRSLLYVEVSGTGPARRIDVGGGVVEIAEGTFTLPSSAVHAAR